LLALFCWRRFAGVVCWCRFAGAVTGRGLPAPLNVRLRWSGVWAPLGGPACLCSSRRGATHLKGRFYYVRRLCGRPAARPGSPVAALSEISIGVESNHYRAPTIDGHRSLK
jgi:hypothetical protein